MGERNYVVESIPFGKRKGSLRYFDTRMQAKEYASRRNSKKNAVTVSKWSNNSNAFRDIVRKDLDKTALFKGNGWATTKGAREMSKDVGTLPKYKTERKNKASRQQPFPGIPFFDPFGFQRR